jgi:hypothetical protein
MTIHSKLLLIGTLLLSSFFVATPAQANCPTANTPGTDTLTISSSCSIPNDATRGADGANIVINSEQTLTLQPGATLVRNSDRSIITNGSIVIFDTAQISQTNMWCRDDDQDGWCRNFTMYAGDTKPVVASQDFVRIASARSISVVDCNDASYSVANSCYTSFYPSFYPGFYPGFWPSFWPTNYPSFYPGFYPSFWPNFWPTNYPSFWPMFCDGNGNCIV